MPADSSLILRAVNGDHGACRSLVEAHGPLVFGMCRRLARDPDDCYQEIWEKVFKALPRFDVNGSAPFRGWLATITRRHLIDRHRQTVARAEVLSLDGLASNETSVQEVLERRDAVAHLEAAIAKLPADQRHAVVQHHIHGVSLESLAADEGVAVGTIKSRLHRGRARLPQLLRRSR